MLCSVNQLGRAITINQCMNMIVSVALEIISCILQVQVLWVDDVLSFFTLMHIKTAIKISYIKYYAVCFAHTLYCCS